MFWWAHTGISKSPSPKLLLISLPSGAHEQSNPSFSLPSYELILQFDTSKLYSLFDRSYEKTRGRKQAFNLRAQMFSKFVADKLGYRNYDDQMAMFFAHTRALWKPFLSPTLSPQTWLDWIQVGPVGWPALHKILCRATQQSGIFFTENTHLFSSPGCATIKWDTERFVMWIDGLNNIVSCLSVFILLGNIWGSWCFIC